MKQYRIIDTETNRTEVWNTERLLAEINRDRSPEWTDYTEQDDLTEAFKHWVASEERYQMLSELSGF